MDEDPQDYSDNSNCCQDIRHFHPEEQNDLQLDSESDTSGIYFPPTKGKEDSISVDVENDIDDLGVSIHSFNESSIDLEPVINGKPIRSPYLLRSRSTSPVRCIASDEISPDRNLDSKNFPKIDLGSKHLKYSQSSQRRVSIKNSLPPVRESEESIAFKMAKNNVEPCSSKSLEDDNNVGDTYDDQDCLKLDSGDKIKAEDPEINEKPVKNVPLVLNINFSLNCEKDKPLILNISPQYQGSNSIEEIKFQFNASTSIHNTIEDPDKTLEISSQNNEKEFQNDKIDSQTEEIGSQPVEIGSQTDEMSIPSITVIEPEEERSNKTTEQNKSITPGPSEKTTNRKGKKDAGEKKQPRAKVAKNINNSQTKKDNHKQKNEKQEGPKRPRNRNHIPRKIESNKRKSNRNAPKRKSNRRYSTSSSSEGCCCSDSTSSTSSCSCSSCCPSSSCDCSSCDD